MTHLGNGLSNAECHEDALSVKEAELAMMRRLGESAENILTAQGNLADMYHALGRAEEALQLKRDVYSGRLKLNGKESDRTLRDASSYAATLIYLKRFQEAKSLLRKTMPVARRVHGESHHLTLGMKANYAAVLYADPDASLDDVREAVTRLEELAPIARRVLGKSHPTAMDIELSLRHARARQTQPKRS